MKKRNKRRLSKATKRKLRHEIMCIIGIISGVVGFLCYQYIPEKNILVVAFKTVCRFGYIYSIACLLAFIDIWNDMSYFKK